MVRMSICNVALLPFLALGLLMMPVPTGAGEQAFPPAGPRDKPVIAKVCANCHSSKQGSLRGNFENVAYKTQSIQIRIDDNVEILKFDKATLRVANVKGENADEPLRDIRKGKEVSVEYVEKDGRRFATAVIAKPPIRIAPEKLISTADVEKLVAQGPEKGKYLLVDARPAPKFMEGAIPTAINIPFPAFDKMLGRLPRDKDAFIVYYCAGVT